MTYKYDIKLYQFLNSLKEMLHNSTSLQPSSSQKQASQPDLRQTKSQVYNQKVYFVSILCDPNILEDPHNSKQRFSKVLWNDKQIKTIKLMPQYIQIAINQKKTATKFETKNQTSVRQLTTQVTLADNEYQKQLQGFKKCFDVDYPALKNIISEKEIDPNEQFNKWLKTVQNTNFVGWFCPLRDDGPHLRKLVISKKTLMMLGYIPQQFSVEIEKYTELATDFLSGPAYKTLFLSYFTSFRKFMSMYVRKDISLEDCIKQSERTLINQMHGKNNRQVKVQMRKTMPNLFTIVYQFIRVVEQSQFRSHQLAEIRNTLASKANTKTFHSLSRFTKLPKDINPANTNKICSYVVIRQPVFQQCIISKEKELKSGSQYELSEQ